MRELYKISYVPNEFNCFFYLNGTNLRQFSALSYSNNCIKIEFGTNLSNSTYSFLSNRSNNSLSNDHVGVNAVYAQLLGLKEGDEVLISKENARLLTCVTVIPKNMKDHELIVKNFDFLENNILNQVKVVAIGQYVPIKLHSNIIATVRIESLEPEGLFGELQECTDFVVVNPPQIPEFEFSLPYKFNEPFVEKKSARPDCFNFTNACSQTSTGSEMDAKYNGDHSQGKNFVINNIMRVFTHFWKNNKKTELNEQETEINEQDNLPEICFSKNNPAYRVNNLLVMENEFPKNVRDKFIIAERLPVSKTVYGPCCFKIFCKIQKVEDNIKHLGFGEGFNYFTYAYVVKFSECENELSNNVYCPDFLLNILNLRTGCYVNIEEVKRKREYMDENRRNSLIKSSKNYMKCDIFTEDMKNIYQSSINTVVSNIRFNEKINTLIVGGIGTGKSYLLHSLMLYFEERQLFSKKIDCKKLRKMKIPNLVKLFSTTLSECCSFQPSVLFIDDLDALLIADEEDNHYKALYSERIANLLASNVSTYQKLNDINIIATISSLSKFKYMSTDRGPTMFDNIFEIRELGSKERNHILTHLISQRRSKSVASYIDYVTGKTKGYNVQDLYDLVEIAAFKSVARNKSENCELEKIDFESALSERVPLSLYGVNLSKNSCTNWSDVGGMEKSKKLLKEMFEWPLKYREIYQSCPLRLQCGVLLYGAPGTGKTLIASAVASECGLNFISVKGPEIFSKYVGASEQGIRDLFMRARKAKPCLLFFDEFDSLAPRRGNSNEDVNDRVVNQILTELDGVEELTEVFILAATSRPDLLDPALLRPGRIDKAIYCGLPEKEERLSILKALSKPMRLSDDVDLEEIAVHTSGYTGADLQAVLYAAQTALVKEIDRENGVENNDILKITRNHLLTGLASTNPSISKEEKIKYQFIYENFISSRMGGVFEKSQEAAQKIMFA